MIMRNQIFDMDQIAEIWSKYGVRRSDVVKAAGAIHAGRSGGEIVVRSREMRELAEELIRRDFRIPALPAPDELEGERRA